MEVAPEIDRHNPLFRYQLITLGSYNGIQKAFIKDLLAEKSQLIKVGETIGDCKLTEISLESKSVRLKPPDGPEFKVNRTQPGK